MPCKRAGVENRRAGRAGRRPGWSPRLSAAWLAVVLALLGAPIAATADSEPGSDLDGTGPSPAAEVRATPPLNPAQALSSGSGVVAGLVVSECGASPLSGCQGQAMPGVEVRIRTLGGETIANVRTADDGAFWVPLPSGSYLVEDEQSLRSIRVDVRAGEMTEVELALPRPSQQP
jgi:hypothetical protein